MKIEISKRNDVSKGQNLANRAKNSRLVWAVSRLDRPFKIVYWFSEAGSPMKGGIKSVFGRLNGAIAGEAHCAGTSPVPVNARNCWISDDWTDLLRGAYSGTTISGTSLRWPLGHARIFGPAFFAEQGVFILNPVELASQPDTFDATIDCEAPGVCDCPVGQAML